MSSVAVALLLTLFQAAEPVATAPATTTPPTSAETEPAPPTPSAPVPYSAPAEPPSVRPFEMPLSTPSAPVPYVPGALDRVPDKPVTLESYRRDYEAPADWREQVYQAGVRRNFDAQQARMGALDGPWTVKTLAGADFMALVIHDPGRPDAEVQGAWRGLGRGGTSGLLLSIRRESEQLVVRWYDKETTGEPTIMRLRQSPDGRWTGTVRSRDVEVPVTMTRGAPIG